MGSWGTGITSNDTYEDINHDFFELYNQGLNVPKITERLIKENQELIDSHEDQNDFWITIAKAQWECKALDQKIHTRIKNIVESGKDIELWEELGASKSDLTKRKKVLSNFLTKISTEKSVIKKRKKKILRNAIFEKGDCLVLKPQDEKHQLVFVLESEKNTEFGLNLIAFLDYNLIKQPDLNDFKKGDVIFTDTIEYDTKIENGIPEIIGQKTVQEPQIAWYYATHYDKAENKFQKIGNLPVNKVFNSEKDCQNFGMWNNIDGFFKEYYTEKKARRKKIALKKYRL